MPSPRELAKSANRADGFDSSVESGYDPVAGTPAGVAPQGAPPDYAADPTNPPDPAAPAANLKR